MDKREIQRKRIKNYFIESTIYIIKKEGLEKLTTKKIGKRAGFSYATIYNYFENFNELICISMIRMAEECNLYVKKNITGNSILERVFSFSDLIIDFNANNPNIYYPFLSSQVDYTYFEKESGDHFMHPAYELMINELEKSDEFKNHSNPQIRLIGDILVCLFHSRLSFYILQKYPKKLDELKKYMRDEIEMIIKGAICK